MQIEKLIEECPFQIGQRVAVRDSAPYAGEWRGEFIITGIRWEYRQGMCDQLNISLASEDEINQQCGDCDGWRPQHLKAVA